MTPNKLSIALVMVVLAGSAFLAVPEAQATMSLAATFDEKVDDANAIVLGRVVRQESRYDEEKRFILTYTTFEVEKSIKGSTPPQVTLVTPGGRVGDVQQTTIGVPVFREGQENIVFLKNTRRGPTVLYFDQGAYDVVAEKGQRLVRPVASEAVHIDPQRGIAVAPEQTKSLRDFEGAVRSSERRVRQQQMSAVTPQPGPQQKPSIWNAIAENLWLIAIAVIGTVLASIHFIRRG
ncbi:MAG TPA: hypothetical protein VFT12_08825 [Thermoanaerobaculia bacterium]|nr:hypothetical protein [Thermoanaerobaculia bacterium]